MNTNVACDLYGNLQAMLKQYGTSVDDSLLTKLVSAFAELRMMADEGLIAYPYSTREVVNIVKHLQVCTDVYLRLIFNAHGKGVGFCALSCLPCCYRCILVRVLAVWYAMSLTLTATTLTCWRWCSKCSTSTVYQLERTELTFS